MPQPLVSVVTPVFNGERYLRECIESVLAQTYQNWEYVIADNRSEDDSLSIAECFAARDDRIRVVEAETRLEMIPNWNRSMREISPSSEYCKVVHADDELLPECLEKMVALAEEEPRAGVIAAYTMTGGEVILDGVVPYPVTVVSGREICRERLLGGDYVFGSPTALLLRSCIVRERDPFYPPDELHADAAVCYEILEAHDFGFVHQVLTHTREHEDSLTSRVATRLYTWRTGKLSMLKKYGPEYLTPEEYEDRLAEALDEHYRFLAKRLLRRRRDSRFWEFHRDELRRIGEPLRRGKLAGAWTRFIAERIFNPGSTIRGQMRTRIPSDR